jgi:fluoride exporter
MSPAGSCYGNHGLGSELKGSSALIKYLMIAVGGAAGAITRYAVGNYIGGRYGFRFPYGTLMINVTGSFVVGFSMALFARGAASPYWRYLIPIGFIGAYTTFSAFEYETLRAIQDGQLGTGLLNVAVSILSGFAAVWIGDLLGRVLV